MSNQLSGRVLLVGQTVQMTSKSGNTFTKRELVLDTTRYDSYTGERSPYDNYALFEFSNDNVSQLDALSVGQVVTVDFTVEGRKAQDKQTGETRYFNSLRGYKVTVRQQGQTQTASQAAIAATTSAVPCNPSGNDPLPF